jgi:hypothetical protein
MLTGSSLAWRTQLATWHNPLRRLILTHHPSMPTLAV